MCYKYLRRGLSMNKKRRSIKTLTVAIPSSLHGKLEKIEDYSLIKRSTLVKELIENSLKNSDSLKEPIRIAIEKIEEQEVLSESSVIT